MYEYELARDAEASGALGRLLQGNVTEEDETTNDQASGLDTTGDGNPLAENEGAVRFGIVFLAAFVVVLVFVVWRSIKYWKLRRERHMLQLQSNRADAVLGDMQMVPGDDYDEDDAELL